MIVIKGNMPKGTGCDGCEFQTSTCEQLDACTCHLFEGTIDNFHNERHKDCPIVGEIPDKHGRIVDEKWVEVYFSKYFPLEVLNDKEMVNLFKLALKEVPTILEASK